ncbi:MAG: glycosyltransferase [Deltaproteobacteria bacterium]|nr:glycosyltransferase [Deltaproteobacteria bacterium]
MGKTSIDKGWAPSASATVKVAVGSALHYSGLLDLRDRVRSAVGRSSPQILAFHDIREEDDPHFNLTLPPRLFRQLMEHLGREYRVLPLQEILNGRSRSPRQIAVTFDDNYRSYYTTVFPIVRQLGIPITIFVSVDPLETKIPLFVDALLLAVAGRQVEGIDLESWGLGVLPLGTEPARHAAVARINRTSKALPRTARAQLLQDVCSRLGVSPAELGFSVLSWDEVREMQRGGVVFGAHTVSHPYLPEIPVEEARVEIVEAKKMLEAGLGTAVDYFACPFGSLGTYDENLVRMAREAGYRAFFTLEGQEGRPDGFKFSRINISTGNLTADGNRMSPALFAMRTARLRSFRTLPSRECSDAGLSVEHGVKATKKLRVLYIMESLCKFAGTEKHLYQLATGLSARGHECRVVAFKTTPQVLATYRAAGVDVVDFPLVRIYGLKAMARFRDLVGLIRGYRPDLVQTFHFMPDTFGVWAAKSAGVRCIVSSRRDMGDLKRTRHILLNRVANPVIKGFISVCDRTKEGLCRREKIHNTKIKTIYNGIDLQTYDEVTEAREEIRTRLGFNPLDFVVGMACVFRAEKDVPCFLRAIAQIRSRVHRLKILLVGDGDMMSAVEAIVQQSGMAGVTTMPGYVHDVRPYIQAMDVACLTPRDNEGLSNVILEEMAMGKPLVVTDVGGNSELVQDGYSGYVVAPGDHSRLGERLYALWADEELRAQFGKAGRKRVEELFTLDRMLTETESFYETMVG